MVAFEDSNLGEKDNNDLVAAISRPKELNPLPTPIPVQLPCSSAVWQRLQGCRHGLDPNVEVAFEWERA
jgi:hypothetical protein